ncbi:peptidoglycan endopeptidase [Peribacillus cavernae]|uniref:Peptidoglycan endopeptidase n=1 Tax=Peribacillus cavernae TaxID=1674310 RepID=A0A3S1BA10_9BACI|nr:C40 family peptidase [Peribacillus cavernae]MDQ0218453.1 peptidoglycan endopeptidase LytE [Peribacillus cavernae]RUQ31452.1 peptidoglycan endopeptidase [Peribacillus cavernae]
MKKHIVTISTAAILSSAFASSTMASTYTVKSGDNLSKIANTHHTTVSKLKRLNNLASDLIHTNQKLTISENAKTAASQITVEKTKTTTYTVKKGDYLIKIANKYGISLAELQSWNKLKGHLIYPGQKLTVSKNGNKTIIELPKNDAPTINNETSTTQTPAAVSTYIVKNGDSLWAIANKSSVSVTDLKSLNNLKSDVIYTGQTLKIGKSTLKPSEAVATSDRTENADKRVDRVISEAKKQIGVPYSWAGSSPSGFDCSGFVYYVFKNAGYQISRLSSSTYYDLGKKVTSPRPGDLVFFSPNEGSKSVISHMGIYLGDRQFIHASSSKGVRISSIDESYFKKRLIGFKQL